MSLDRLHCILRLKVGKRFINWPQWSGTASCLKDIPSKVTFNLCTNRQPAAKDIPPQTVRLTKRHVIPVSRKKSCTRKPNRRWHFIGFRLLHSGIKNTVAPMTIDRDTQLDSCVCGSDYLYISLWCRKSSFPACTICRSNLRVLNS